MKDTFDKDNWCIGWGGKSVWQGGPRMQRGDMTPIILRILLLRPMHGYEIIRTLEERSFGWWRPSAGSVYPTLQMLEEQELVISQEQDGKKVYSLTEKGIQEAKGSRKTNPWERKKEAAQHFREIGSSVHEILNSLKEITFKGSEVEISEAKVAIAEFRSKLVSIAEKSKKDYE